MPAIREFLAMQPETTFGVYNSAATPTYIVLPDSNSTTVRKRMNFQEQTSAGRSGRRTNRLGRTYNVGGKLKTRLLPAQAQTWLDLLINTTGGNCPDLRSATLTHGFLLEDACAYNVNRYTGCKFNGTVSGDDQGQDVMLDLDVMGSDSAPVADGSYTVPPLNDPTDFALAFGFQQSAGLLTWGFGTNGTDPSGTPTIRTKYSSFSLDVGNVFDQYRGETPYMQAITWKMRNPSLTIRNVYRSKQDRIDYEGIIARAIKLGLNFGGNILTFNLGGNNYIDEPQDDLQMAGRYIQTVTAQVFADPTTGEDITATYVPFTPSPTPTPTPTP